MLKVRPAQALARNFPVRRKFNSTEPVAGSVHFLADAKVARIRELFISSAILLVDNSRFERDCV